MHVAPLETFKNTVRVGTIMFDNVVIRKSLRKVMTIKTRFCISLALVLCLAMVSGAIIPSSSYSSASRVPSSPFPYIPGLGPTSADASTVSPSTAANNSTT